MKRKITELIELEPLAGMTRLSKTLVKQCCEVHTIQTVAAGSPYGLGPPPVGLPSIARLAKAVRDSGHHPVRDRTIFCKVGRQL